MKYQKDGTLIKDQFNVRIKEIMDHYSLSNEQFADKIGIEKKTLAYLLSGKHRPQLGLIANICWRFSEVDIYWFFFGEGKLLKSVDQNAPDDYLLHNSKNIVERIECIRMRVGMNNRVFASEIGIHGSSLCYIQSGRNKPSLEVIRSIYKRFPQFNARWLLFGESNIPISKLPIIKMDVRIELVTFTTTPLEINNRIKEIMIHYSMGIEQFSEEIRMQENTLVYLLRGRSRVHLYNLVSICKRFNEININWLLLGEGEFLSIDPQTAPNTSSSKKSDSIVDRIQSMKNQVGMDNQQFSTKIGIQESTLIHILSGRNQPSVDVICSISKRFPQFNLRWIVLGEGEMLSITA